MNIENHRHNTCIKLDDDEERSEGELDSSFSDNDDDDDDEILPKTTCQPQQTSQSWTNMLT
ncbi:unnamed protein product, partial [Adineta steineri]